MNRQELQQNIISLEEILDIHGESLTTQDITQINKDITDLTAQLTSTKNLYF